MTKKNKNKHKNKDKDNKNEFVVARNKKARYDYEIIESIEAGIILNGSEVKSLREGNAVLTGAFVRIKNGELFLEGLEIQPYSHASTHTKNQIKRQRKLLMHREQINKWAQSVEKKDLTITAMSVYFTRGMAKIEIALARGKKVHDKRQDLKKKDTQRGLERLKKYGK